jgi:hypothetical protein
MHVAIHIYDVEHAIIENSYVFKLNERYL